MCKSKVWYENRARKYTDIQAQIKDLEKELAQLGDEIRADMGEAESKEAGAFVIHWPVITERRFNAKAFQVDHKKLYEAFREERTYRKFSVTAAR